MGDIQKKITADNSDILQKLQEVHERYDKLLQKMREMKDSQSSGSSVIDEIKGMATQYLSVSTAVNLVQQSVQHLIQTQQEAAQVFGRTNEEIVKGLARAGLAGQADQVKEFSLSVAGRRPEDVAAALFGVSEGGVGLSQSKREEAARVLAVASPLFGGPENNQSVGQVVGRFAEIFPQLSGRQAVDLVLAAQAMSGKDAEKLGSTQIQSSLRALTAQGASMGESVAVATMMLSEDVGNRGGAKLLDALMSTEEIGSPTSPQDRLKQRFLRGDFHQRLGMLQSDERMREVMLGGRVGDLVGRLSGPEFESRVKAVDFAVSGEGDTKQRVRDLLRTDTGQDVFQDLYLQGEKARAQQTAGRGYDAYMDSAQALETARLRGDISGVQWAHARTAMWKRYYSLDQALGFENSEESAAAAEDVARGVLSNWGATPKDQYGRYKAGLDEGMNNIQRATLEQLQVLNRNLSQPPRTIPRAADQE